MLLNADDRSRPLSIGGCSWVSCVSDVGVAKSGRLAGKDRRLCGP
jgi:hypothetical protein